MRSRASRTSSGIGTVWLVTIGPVLTAGWQPGAPRRHGRLIGKHRSQPEVGARIGSDSVTRDHRTRNAAVTSFTGCAAIIVSVAMTGCGALAGQPTFHDLRVMVGNVPVPPGLQPGPIRQATNDGPGFTTAKFREVWRGYRTTLTCRELEAEWTATLHRARVPYSIVRHTRADFGYPLEVLTLRASGAHLAITLGDGKSDCSTPAIEAYTDPS